MKENWRHKLKKLGRCSRCRQPSVVGKTMCMVCLNGIKERRRHRISESQCVYCGGPATGKTICIDCASERARDREERKDAGLCVNTGCPNDTRPGRVTCAQCSVKVSKKTRILKQLVLDHYGQRCNCSCGCSVAKFEHLTIDHKNNDGAKRRKDGQHHCGQANYRRIIREGFPDDLQVLCWNCNCAKQYYGGC